ncbi:hypothetical protein RFI_35844, partial [Reticulomyxa filosa]
NKYEEAEKKYLEAIKIDANCLNGYLHYAYLLTILGKIDSAQSYYEQAYQVISRLSSDYYYYNDNHASSHRQKKLTKKAFEYELENQRSNLLVNINHHFFKKLKQLDNNKTQQLQKAIKEMQEKEERVALLTNQIASLQTNFDDQLDQIKKEHQNSIAQLQLQHDNQTKHLQTQFEKEKQLLLERYIHRSTH